MTQASRPLAPRRLLVALGLLGLGALGGLLAYAPAGSRAAAPVDPVVLSAPPQPELLHLHWSAPEPRWDGQTLTRPEVGGTERLPLSAEQWRALRSGAWGPEHWRSLRPTLDALYARLEARRPGDLRFYRGSAGWVAQAQTGWVVDRRATEEALLAAGRSGDSHSVVKLRLQAPARSARWAQAQGLRHLGSGESDFAGSPDFRVHNIVTSARQFDRVWVRAGRSFDFNAQLGPITAQRGFRPGYVISGGTLALEDGGGVCQVSTTVYRAALWAGLTITERHAHSRQVAYYGEPGLDAAVYAPAKNLRFRNDTPGPLLMQTEWDLKTQRLSVHLFGRSDGREVRLSAPQVSGLRPGLEPRYLADPALAPGEAQRLDMPAAGARVRVVRELYWPDGRRRSERVESRYQPWGGAFAVAPGDPRLSGE